MDLNARYGFAVPPQAHGLRPGEDMLAPKSLITLEASTGVPQKVPFMTAVQEGCLLAGLLDDSITILWIMDQAGSLRIAIEEAYFDGTDRIPLVNALKPMLQKSGWNKLGHPALLDEEKLGRIAGEITFLPQENAREINNLSGRYGLGLDRKATHLENVAAILRACGLRIIIDFNELRMS
jgi:hypothetical protein